MPSITMNSMDESNQAKFNPIKGLNEYHKVKERVSILLNHAWLGNDERQELEEKSARLKEYENNVINTPENEKYGLYTRIFIMIGASLCAWMIFAVILYLW